MSKNILLNIFTQNLFRSSNKQFTDEVSNVLCLDSFTKDIKDKKLKVKYLHTYSRVKESLDPFSKTKVRIYKDCSFEYTNKNHSIIFNYDKENLPQTIKLLNINIVNTYSYYIINTLLKLQAKFINSTMYIDLKYIHYDTIIMSIEKQYGIKIYKSHISNFLKKTTLY